MLKRLYIKVQEYEMYDCGHKMQLCLDSHYFSLCEKFNLIQEKLSKLDDKCPNFKFELNNNNDSIQIKI